jgi:hypothetical protein
MPALWLNQFSSDNFIDHAPFLSCPSIFAIAGLQLFGEI